MKFRWTESLGLVTVGLLAAGAAGQSRVVITMHHCGSISLPSRTTSVLTYRVRKMAAPGKRSLRALKTCKCAVAKKMRPSRGGCRNGRNSLSGITCGSYWRLLPKALIPG
jgi:hypothetical protein